MGTFLMGTFIFQSLHMPVFQTLTWITSYAILMFGIHSGGLDFLLNLLVLLLDSCINNTTFLHSTSVLQLAFELMIYRRQMAMNFLKLHSAYMVVRKQ